MCWIARLTPRKLKARLQHKSFQRRRFTSLLLDQGFLAGLGNYLRSEILFVARVHPTLRPIDCDEQQILSIGQKLRSQFLLNLTKPKELPTI